MKRDDGSIMMLAIGLAVIVVMVVATAVNITSLWIARSELNSLSDGAALAGAQAVDTNSVYTDGIAGGVVLNAAEARLRVRAYVSRTDSDSGLSHVAIARISVERTTVTVALTADATVPFPYLLPSRGTRVASTARAINRLR